MLILLKLLYAWLLPPGIFLLAIAAVYFYNRKTKHAKRMLLLFALIYLTSISTVSDRIIQPLENWYGQPAVSDMCRLPSETANRAIISGQIKT